MQNRNNNSYDGKGNEIFTRTLTAKDIDILIIRKAREAWEGIIMLFTGQTLRGTGRINTKDCTQAHC